MEKSGTSINNEFELQKLEIQYHYCLDIYNSKILMDSYFKFTDALFTKLLIELSDILQYLKTKGQRVDFNNDIKVGDVTDLITKCRNGACHVRTSGENNAGNGSHFVFNRMVGKGIAIKKGSFEFGSDYEDDVALGFGFHRVYLIRHIGKALEEIPIRITALRS